MWRKSAIVNCTLQQLFADCTTQLLCKATLKLLKIAAAKNVAIKDTFGAWVKNYSKFKLELCVSILAFCEKCWLVKRTNSGQRNLFQTCSFYLIRINRKQVCLPWHFVGLEPAPSWNFVMYGFVFFVFGSVPTVIVSTQVTIGKITNRYRLRKVNNIHIDFIVIRGMFKKVS